MDTVQQKLHQLKLNCIKFTHVLHLFYYSTWFFQWNIFTFAKLWKVTFNIMKSKYYCSEVKQPPWFKAFCSWWRSFFPSISFISIVSFSSEFLYFFVFHKFFQTIWFYFPLSSSISVCLSVIRYLYNMPMLHLSSTASSSHPSINLLSFLTSLHFHSLTFLFLCFSSPSSSLSVFFLALYRPPQEFWEPPINQHLRGFYF